MAAPAAAPAAASRKVLHVQSISSWAPSCIGPYSQVSAELKHTMGSESVSHAGVIA